MNATAEFEKQIEEEAEMMTAGPSTTVETEPITVEPVAPEPEPTVLETTPVVEKMAKAKVVKAESVGAPALEGVSALKFLASTILGHNELVEFQESYHFETDPSNMWPALEFLAAHKLSSASRPGWFESYRSRGDFIAALRALASMALPSLEYAGFLLLFSEL